MKAIYYPLALLLTLTSCQNQPEAALAEVQTTLLIQAEKPIAPESLALLTKQFEARFQKAGFPDATLKVDTALGQIVVQAGIDPEDGQSLPKYRSLFGSTSLDIWNTYRISDPALEPFLNALPDLDGFLSFRSLPMGGMQPEVLGICTQEARLQPLLDTLNQLTSDLPDLRFVWSKGTETNSNGAPEGYRLFLIKATGEGRAPLTEADVVEASASPNAYTGDAMTMLTLSEAATKKWSEMTQKAANDDNRSLAIVIDGRAQVVPRVMTPILSGQIMIAGNMTPEESQALAWGLWWGQLAIPVEVLEEKILGPSQK